MSAQSVPSIVVSGVLRIESAHARGQLRRSSPEDQVVVIEHQNERPQSAAGLFESMGKEYEELFAIFIVSDQFQSTSTSGKDMPVCRLAIESPHLAAA